MDSSTALAMAGIMNRDSFKKLDRLALDTLMELANLIVARAVSSLNDRGFAFRLTPPLIFTGANLSFFSSLDTETLVVPLRANVGDMNLSVALRMNVV
jgi:chemotaxis protein CheX